MSERLQRILWGLLMVPAAALLGFLVGGSLAALTADSGSALADGATAALGGLAAAAMAAGAAGWSASRHRLVRLPVITLSLIVLAGAGTWIARARASQRRAAREAPAEVATPPQTTTSKVAASEPDLEAAAPIADSIVGLLTLAGIAEPGDRLRPLVELRVEPDAGSEVRFVVQRLDELEYRESGYEEPAAVVLGVSGDWLLLTLPDGGTGWTLPPEGSAFAALEALVVNRLNYLTGAWSRRVSAAPGGPSTPVGGIDPGARETSAEVHEAREVDGTLWLRVTIHEFSPCEGDPPRVATGWVPAWTDGEPTAWFHSRGC